MITSLEQAEKILKTFVPAVSKTGDDQSLERMWPALEAVGNPHQQLRVIHVAGTSGKTSTSYYIAAQLQTSGKKIGLTVSPHVDKVTERIQINGSPLEDNVFCSYLDEFLALVNGIELSYFELLIVFILWVFKKENVDYVVLETGMGGLYDGTNVVSREDKVCVITDIGYDHMNILGDTLDKIAFQKAGIIHDKNIVFSQAQSPEAMAVIEKHCSTLNAQLTVIEDKDIQKTNLYSYQQRNWELASRVVAYIAQRDSLSVKVLDPLKVYIPGRMEERVLEDDSILIMDGAHNGQKMAAFVRSFSSTHPNVKATVLLSLKQGKEMKDVLKELKPITNKLIVTEFTSFQDLPFSAIDANSIVQAAKEIGINAISCQDYREAADQLLKYEGQKIITGSFYLLSDVRKIL